ncbi:MAG: archaeosortase/exosortase family protein [Paludibacter sp.]|nr:archaeosortase/exosortase family protein [Paludibacter sp.]
MEEIKHTENGSEKSIFGKYKQYSGIFYFIIILMIAHFVWKLLVVGEESDVHVTFLGLDISLPFRFMVRHIALVCNKIINILGFGSTLRFGYNIWFPDVQRGINVIWGCTAIKQSYIFICIIVFYRGAWQQKLWYIPAGLVVIYLFNIFRISTIAIITKFHPEWFYFVHEILLKLLFYFVIFSLWVLWEEKFVRRKIKKV